MYPFVCFVYVTYLMDNLIRCVLSLCLKNCWYLLESTVMQFCWLLYIWQWSMVINSADFARWRSTRIVPWSRADFCTWDAWIFCLLRWLWSQSYVAHTSGKNQRRDWYVHEVNQNIRIHTFGSATFAVSLLQLCTLWCQLKGHCKLCCD